MRNFRELNIWKEGIVIVKEVYFLIEKFPNKEKYGLYSQMSSCAVSIPSNIAEGCSRDSQKDFSRFLQIALGSSFEVETQLTISQEIGLISKSDFHNVFDKLTVLQKQINALKKYVNTQK